MVFQYLVKFVSVTNSCKNQSWKKKTNVVFLKQHSKYFLSIPFFFFVVDRYIDEYYIRINFDFPKKIRLQFWN